MARSAFRSVFGVPLVLGTMTAVGLVSALVGDGVWDALSWLCLGTPLVVAVLHARRHRVRTQQRDTERR